MKALCPMLAIAAKRKIQEQRGGIVLFLLICWIALLLIAGLLVDTARIFVAERKVANALESAARSVLAGCEPALAGQFALYGVNHGDMTGELERYLFNNLAERHQGFRIIDYRIEQTTIKKDPVWSLLNNEVFEEQILEYMKYKAPLMITENVVGKYRQGAFQRKAQAGTMIAAAAQQGKAVRERAADYNKALLAGGRGFQGGAGEMLPYLAELQGKLTLLSRETAAYRESLDQAMETQRAVGTQTGQSYVPVTPDPEITLLEEEGVRLAADLRYNAELLEKIIPLEAELAAWEEVEGEEAARGRRLLRGRINSLASQWVFLEEMGLAKAEDITLDHKDVQDKEDLLHRLKGLFSSKLPQGPEGGLLISREDFAAANKAWGESPAFEFDHKEPEAKLSQMRGDNDYAERAATDLFSIAGNFSRAVEEAMAGGAERLGICEYIMDKYTFATSRTKRGHFFELGEAEYILWGHDAEIANVTEMFMKIFTIRLALNALDDFIKSPLPHPMARLAKALTEGFAQACRDMTCMYEGRPVALCPGLEGVTLSYSDYLRLFLLVQDKETQLERMRQLIQVNVRSSSKNFDLKECWGSFTAGAQVSINLFFLPALHLDKLGFPGFSPDGYKIFAEVTVGY